MARKGKALWTVNIALFFLWLAAILTADGNGCIFGLPEQLSAIAFLLSLGAGVALDIATFWVTRRYWVAAALILAAYVGLALPAFLP